MYSLSVAGWIKLAPPLALPEQAFVPQTRTWREGGSRNGVSGSYLNAFRTCACPQEVKHAAALSHGDAAPIELCGAESRFSLMHLVQKLLVLFTWLISCRQWLQTTWVLSATHTLQKRPTLKALWNGPGNSNGLTCGEVPLDKLGQMLLPQATSGQNPP